MTTAPQSPPCATNFVYPRRFISTTQARAMRSGPQPVRGRLARESVARHRRDHHVERIRCAPAMRRGIGQRIDDLQLLDDRAGPSVRDDERQRIFVFRTNVNEMNVQPIDLGDEVAAGRSASPRPCASRIPSPNSARASASSRAARLAYASVTVSRSGHLVALMRLRNSVSSASGTFT